MDFASPLISGVLITRYKRFLADIRLDSGEIITAHCANPGSMIGVAVAGAPVWVSHHTDGKRKLAYSWVLAQIDDALIAINTTNPNKIIAEAIAADRIAGLRGYETMQREVRYGSSRIDFLLKGGQRRPCYVEVKNVHLRREAGLAEFPDSVTKRGAKHLDELIALSAGGARAMMMFVVQRSDCKRFRPAADLDPVYAEKLQAAANRGVELRCYDCEVSLRAVELRDELPIELSGL